jgi:hypothetical protein
MSKEKEEFQEYFEERKKAKLDSHSGLQKRKLMTQEEKSRDAIDFFTKEFKEHAERQGKEISDDAARKEAVDLARRTERKAGR